MPFRSRYNAFYVGLTGDFFTRSTAITIFFIAFFELPPLTDMAYSFDVSFDIANKFAASITYEYFESFQ
jgi:hypothetical protein